MVWDEFATATCSVYGDVGDLCYDSDFQCIINKISHQHLELITKIFRPQHLTAKPQQGGATSYRGVPNMTASK